MSRARSGDAAAPVPMGLHAQGRPAPDTARRRLTLGGGALTALAALAALGGAGCGVLTPQAGVQAPVDDRRADPGAGPAAVTADTPAGLPAGVTPPPSSPREFRGAWVASVNNIDWPSRPGLPNAAWRAEALAILDRARAIGLNAIVLQVRPAADALYASAIEPWSEVLTGLQGRAPSPPDDPLAFWVAEAHRRGLELHAWFNPYRARHPSTRGPLAAQHIANRRAHAVKRYGDQLWMDPAEPDAVAQTLAVVADVVRRYDIDGVHIDDYFYPYPIAAGASGSTAAGDGAEPAELPFPDEPAWQRYRSGGGTLERADWRREQVDSLVEALHRTVHEIKPRLRFGISPFGIGKPALRGPGIVGFSQYDKLYADVERWLAKGWLDYLAPQLYWPLDRPGQAFEPLLAHWLAHNPLQRHVWPGLFTSMVGAAQGTGSNTTPWPAAEVLQQVERVRARHAQGADGHIHFSMSALMQDRDGIATWLRAGPYAQPALTPPAPGQPVRAPAAPSWRRDAGGALLVEAAAGEQVNVWSVWRRREGEWRFEVHPAARPLRLSVAGDLLVVRAVDIHGIEGEAIVLR